MSHENLPVLSVPTSVVPLNYVHPGLSLAQIFSIVRAYWKQILLIGLTGMALTVLVVALLPRTYASTVTLMVNYEINDPLNGKELPVGLLGSYIATQIELMQNPEVLLEVVDRLKLTSNKDYASGYSGSDKGTLREWAAKQVGKNLTVFQGQFGSQLIYVTYSANNAMHAALVANTIADVYKEQDYLRATSLPSERLKLYAEQMDELKSKVIHAQENVTAFRQRNNLVDTGSRANIDVDLLGTLEQRLLEASNARRVAEAHVMGDAPAGDQVVVSTLAQSLSAAQRREQNLQTAVAQQRAKVLAGNQVSDEAAKYLLELDSAQSVYKRALDGYDQVMFASNGNYTNTSVVSRATAPVKADKPRVLRDLFLGFVATGLLALGIPLCYELLRRRVRCRDDLERDHGIPVLAEFDAMPMITAAT